MRNICAMALGFVLLTSAAVAGSAYDDPPPHDHWAWNALDFLQERGVYPEGYGGILRDKPITFDEVMPAVRRLAATLKQQGMIPDDAALVREFYMGLIEGEQLPLGDAVTVSSKLMPQILPMAQPSPSPRLRSSIFSDVPQDHWAYAALVYLEDAGVIP